MTNRELYQIYLENYQYPEAKGKDLQCHAGDYDWKGKVIRMTPEKYLKLAAKILPSQVNQTSIVKLKDRIHNQLPIDPLVLYVDMNTKRVIGHEGRHRALAAIDKNIQQVPVFIFTGSCFKRVPKWSPEDHKEVNDADFIPEDGYSADDDFKI
jgi:hypothetical protein